MSTVSLSCGSGMSILHDIAQSASFDGTGIVVTMQSGIQHRFLVSENPRLARGTPEQLRNIEISPFGLHWPDLDEDLSFRGLAAGDFGQRRAN
jgi:hypothetical protein